MSNCQIVKLNVLAKDMDNARAIMEAANGRVYVGLMVKNFANVDEAVAKVNQYQAAQINVSVGLGAGDPNQWRKVAEVAARTKPAHVNQVFPAAGYTLGLLAAAGSTHTLVNALIAPSGIPGKVSILTGPVSQNYQEYISCDAAAALLKEIGIQSVKFYPIGGDKHLAEVAEMVKAAVKQGITVFEPTGGIDRQSVYKVVETCAENGAQTIIPHIYTAFADKETGVTNADEVGALLRSF